MMNVSQKQPALSIVWKDLELSQLRGLNLEDQIMKLGDIYGSLHSAKAGLKEECRTLQQKVEILNELLSAGDDCKRK